MSALLGRLAGTTHRTRRRPVRAEHGEQSLRLGAQEQQAGAQEGLHLPAVLIEGGLGVGAFVELGPEVQRLEPVLAAHGKESCHSGLPLVHAWRTFVSGKPLCKGDVMTVMTTENRSYGYGIWSDLMGGFIDVRMSAVAATEERSRRIAEEDEDADDLTVIEECPDHEEQPRATCEECAAEGDDDEE